MRSLSRRTGFTLIELIAVIVVLAVLAGVALPRYFDYADDAHVSATKGALGGVRAGLANWYANEALTNGAPTYPTFVQLYALGTVMQELLPENPYNDDATIRDADTLWVAGNPPIAGANGWAYDETAGKFWANSTTAGVNEHQW